MKQLILILAVAACLTSCTCNDNSSNTMKEGNFVHSVYFWLHNPDNNEDRQAFEKSLTNFINNSEFIQTKHLGTPADTDRGVIDTSYTYCLIVTFENKAMHDKYQVEAGHLQFIEESSKLWDKVLIYDSENLLQ